MSIFKGHGKKQGDSKSINRRNSEYYMLIPVKCEGYQNTVNIIDTNISANADGLHDVAASTKSYCMLSVVIR